MNILTWNINGIRATKVPLKKLFDRLDADIICLQETKVTRDQLDELSAIVEGYNSYFSFSKVRSGYSGVATFVKDSATPIKAEEGLAGILGSSDDTQVGCYGDHSGFITEELNALDREGRTMITQHRILTADGEPMIMTVINVYCPRADPDNGERLAYKLNFYRLLQLRSEALLPHSHVVIVGDMNTSHKRIDHCDPDPAMEFERNPGRLWLSEFLAGDVGEIGRKPPSEDEVLHNGGGMLAKFIDTFRYFHPCQRDAYTCWRTTSGARATNYGTRIDYIFADRPLATTAFTDCVIRPDVDGSDHCPVTATLDIACVPSSRCPKLCTRHMPEFAGRQQKLLTFFPKTAPTGCATINRKCEGSGLDDGSSLPTSEEDHASSSSSQGASDPDASMIPSVLDTRPVASNANRRCLSTGVKRKAATNRKNHGQVKQGNLLSFFHRPADRQPEACSDLSTAIPGFNVNVSNKQNTASSVNKVDSHSCLKIIMNDAAELSDNQQMVDKKVAQLRDCRSSTPTWKHLLSGPPVAPLCRGHKEACVLRTVKKMVRIRVDSFGFVPDQRATELTVLLVVNILSGLPRNADVVGHASHQRKCIYCCRSAARGKKVDDLPS